jgi:hypothetical protein
MARNRTTVQTAQAAASALQRQEQRAAEPGDRARTGPDRYARYQSACIYSSLHGKTQDVGERYDPATVADDLGECRQRGLDWLDRNTSSQRRIQAASLEQLAADYADARGLLAPGRIRQIKRLVEDGIAELRTQGHPGDAALLLELFFGSAPDGPIPPPGVLLDSARKKAGETEARFRERRSALMRSFAQFLITYVESISRSSSASERADTLAKDTSRHYQTPQIGSAARNEHFIELLASAVNATIIGITNEHLLPALQAALSRKREIRPDAFWNSLRIVFLSESLLNTINDEREEFGDPVEALRQRSLELSWARRSIRVFLKRAHSTRWALYDWNYAPTLTGSLFEFQDGRKLVHLLIRPPGRPASDHLFIDVSDRVDRLSAVFEDIVHRSASDTMIVPVGAPSSEGFECNGVRLHAQVLKDGSGQSGWLPIVIVLTSHIRNGKAEAVLQLRTVDNASREENRLSHLTGNILHEDRVRPSGRPLAEVPKTFDMAHATPLSAAKRLVKDAAGTDLGTALRPVTTGSYLYPDKEHLFFFVFVLSLPEGLHLPRRAEMHQFRLSELLAIRANQVLCSAVQVCRNEAISQRSFALAAEVLALNLVLHDRDDLAVTMLGLIDESADKRAAAAQAMSELVVDRTAPSWMDPSREVLLKGLAGWHYREFFSTLLRLYAEIGIDGAAELWAAIDGDEKKRAARDRLADLYQDEDVIAGLPPEL